MTGKRSDNAKKSSTPGPSASRARATKTATKNESTRQLTPGQHIDARIAELADWRGDLLARIRATIKDALPDVVEEWKWRGVPTWYQDGMLCTGETYKDHVKMTFAKGARLDDPKKLFNQPGTVRRAIDLYEGDTLDAKALGALLREAAALNRSK